MNRLKLAQMAGILSIGIFTIISSGCAGNLQASSDDIQPATISVSCDEFSSNQNISKEVDLTNGGMVNVELCSNPSTGFQWGQPQVTDPAIATQTDHDFVEADQVSGSEPMVGASGKDVWTFKALDKGITTIAMEYGRPWEGGEKAQWTFNLTINVK